MGEAAIVLSDGSVACVVASDIDHIDKGVDKSFAVNFRIDEDGWGETMRGLRTQLIVQNEGLVIGQPMKLSVVVQNVSDSVRCYDKNIIACTPLLVRNEGGIGVTSKSLPCQRIIAHEAIGSGEIRVLVEEVDLGERYLLDKPGKYVIQASGAYGAGDSMTFPASREFEIEIHPGPGRKEDPLVRAIDEALPSEDWAVQWVPVDKSNAVMLSAVMGMVVDEQGTLLEVVRAGPRREARPGKDRISGFIWITVSPVRLHNGEGKFGVDEGTTRPEEGRRAYLGRNSSGHVHVWIPSEAEELWPNMLDEIKKALGLEESGGTLKSTEAAGAGLAR